MENIEYEYVSKTTCRNKKHTYLFNCRHEVNKFGTKIVRYDALTYGAVGSFTTRQKGWYILKSFWIEEEKILEYYTKETGIKKYKLK